MKRTALLTLLLIVLPFTITTGRGCLAVTTQSSSRAEVSIPFELVLRHIVIPVSVNKSRPLSFVFDTGNKVGIIDTERAKELGLNLQGQVRIGGAGSQTLL